MATAACWCSPGPSSLSFCFRLDRTDPAPPIAGRQIPHSTCNLCIPARVFPLTPCWLSGFGLPVTGVPVWTVSCKEGKHVNARKATVMKIVATEMGGVREALERKEAELGWILRARDGIAIEKSADQMDEIQYASERDLAIRNVDRDSALLRQVKAALRRIHADSFGTCIDCEYAISSKRLAAVPWATRCIQCQETAERERQESSDETLVNAA